MYRKNIDWYLHEHMLLLEAAGRNKVIIADGFCFAFSQIHFDFVVVYSDISQFDSENVAGLGVS